jgi:aspartyl/asparaginyl-tRNA synthetase
MNDLIINPCEFHGVVRKLRSFFEERGFVEVHTQNRLSILAACEDPSTIATYNYAGSVWPLPQTGQMWLEYELLNNPTPQGYYCVSTSYRNEPNPVEGRHNLIFPMFEFESKGNFDDMLKLECDLVEYLGYGKSEEIPSENYVDIANKYGVKELEHEHENMIYKDYGSAFLLKNFPVYTSPFWNMKYNKTANTSNKCDVIMSGQETIGSAERSCDPEEMKHMFQTISNSMYSKTLYTLFGKKRVDNEMESFLKYDFFPRFGGGIGITRLIKSMKMENLL